MKKFTCLGLSMVLALGLLAGCGGDTSTSTATSGSGATTSQETESDTTTQLSGSVSTDGSTSMEEVIGVLGEQFNADTGVSVTPPAPALALRP